MNKLAALHRLLCQLFEGQDLRRFVRFGEQGESIVAELPAQIVSLTDLAEAVIDRLHRCGLMPATFARLREEYPLRAAEIDAVAGLWVDDSARLPPIPGHDEVPVTPADGLSEADDVCFDVFFSYHDADRPAVAKIADVLADRGVRAWLDAWELRPGQLRVDQTERIIGQVRTAVVFIGPAGVKPWQQMEVHALLQQFVARGCPVIPVLLAGAAGTPELPLFLRNFTWVDLRDSARDPIDQLVWGITGKRPTRGARLS